MLDEHHPGPEHIYPAHGIGGDHSDRELERYARHGRVRYAADLREEVAPEGECQLFFAFLVLLSQRVVENAQEL